jgi:alpha-galactosidase
MKKNSIRPFVLAATVSLALISAFVLKNGDDNKDVFSLNSISPTPPMGWNSFDAYDCRIDENTFLKTVDFMDNNLKEYGWEYAVIDYIWWHPDPGHYNTAESHERRIGHPDIRYNKDGSPLNPDNTRMDEYGRLIPAVERFPSSEGGEGFKAIGDYIHKRGMKFGIHIMRGIHRNAVFENLPIKGSKYTARDIAEPWDTCRWNNHMFGVDPSKPGAQEYYNSLFELYASWGVDFIKADDVLYPPFHKEEVELMRNAIKNSGRPMVLSLSPGEAHLGEANFLKGHANMWRVSADFWDEWAHLKHNFDLLNAWSSHTGNGSWPDADMIPFGKISLDNRPHGPERESNFTKDEKFTLMTLWSIARSPLMIGADLLSSPAEDIAFFQNSDVIYVNQQSENGRQVMAEKNHVVWLAEDQNSDDLFIALFNLSENQEKVIYNLEWDQIRGKYDLKDLWEQSYSGVVENFISADIPRHGAKMFRLTKKI